MHIHRVSAVTWASHHSANPPCSPHEPLGPRLGQLFRVEGDGGSQDLPTSNHHQPSHRSPAQKPPGCQPTEKQKNSHGKLLMGVGLPLPPTERLGAVAQGWAGWWLWWRLGALSCRERLPGPQTVRARLPLSSTFHHLHAHLHPPCPAIIQLALCGFLLCTSHCYLSLTQAACTACYICNTNNHPWPAKDSIMAMDAV